LKIGIVGTGGVGGYFGGKLAKKHLIATPINEFIYNCILPMEIKARRKA
jgi:ketopantoate reductase